MNCCFLAVQQSIVSRFVRSRRRNNTNTDHGESACTEKFSSLQSPRRSSIYPKAWLGIGCYRKSNLSRSVIWTIWSFTMPTKETWYRSIRKRRKCICKGISLVCVSRSWGEDTSFAPLLRRYSHLSGGCIQCVSRQGEGHSTDQTIRWAFGK